MTTPIGKRSYFGATPDNTELSAGCGSGDLLLNITTINPASWPNTSWGPFMITIDPEGAEEHALVSAVTSTQFTIPALGRGRDGTVAQAHNAGVKIIHGWDGESAQDTNNHIQDPTRNDHTQYALVGTQAFHSSGGTYAPNPNELTIIQTSGATVQLPSAPPLGTTQEIVNMAISSSAANLVTIARGGTDSISWPGGSGGVSSFVIPQGARAIGYYNTGVWWFRVEYTLKPYAQGGTTTATSLPNNTFTTIPIVAGANTVLGYGFTISGSGLAVPAPGVYDCHAEVSANSSPPVTAVIAKNGSTLIDGAAGGNGLVPGAQAIGIASGLIVCAAGDILTLVGFQVTGSSQTSMNSSGVTFLHAYYVGPA